MEDPCTDWRWRWRRRRIPDREPTTSIRLIRIEPINPNRSTTATYSQSVSTKPSYLALLLCILILLCTTLPLTSAWTYQYFYTVEPIMPHEIDTTWTTWSIANTATLTDDIGADPIALPFTFQFFQPYRQLWITPNGGLSFTSDQTPCCTDPQTCYFVDSNIGCTLNSTAFTNMIMGCLTDLDPGLLDAAQIYYRISPTRFDVRYDGIPLWHQEPQGFGYTFTITLFSTGIIQFRYYEVVDPRNGHSTVISPLPFIPGNPKTDREWLVGLRPKVMSSRDQLIHQLLDPTYVPTLPRDDPANVVAEQQFSDEMHQWGTDYPGIYPHLADVKANHTITFCYLTTDWCLYPTYGLITDDTMLYLSSHDLSCAVDGQHQFACQFHPVNTTATVNNTLLINATYDANFKSLKCLIPDFDNLTAVTGTPNQLMYQVTLIDLSAANSVQTIYMENELIFTYRRHLPSVLPGFCNQCSSQLPDYCWTDCFGTYRGNATLDGCGQCSGGLSGKVANSDMSCAGICFEAPQNRTSVQCFCDLIYQKQITSPSTITATGAQDNLKWYSVVNAGPVSFGHSPHEMFATTVSAPASATSSPIDAGPLLSSTTHLPTISAGDVPVFRSDDLPQPVPALCSFEVRHDIKRTLFAPMFFYEIAFIVFLIVLAIVFIAKREYEKHADLLLPQAIQPDGGAPIIHIPSQPHTPQIVSSNSSSSLSVPSPQPSVSAVPPQPSPAPSSPEPQRHSSSSASTPEVTTILGLTPPQPIQTTSPPPPPSLAPTKSLSSNSSRSVTRLLDLPPLPISSSAASCSSSTGSGSSNTTTPAPSPRFMERTQPQYSSSTLLPSFHSNQQLAFQQQSSTTSVSSQQQTMMDKKQAKLERRARRARREERRLNLLAVLAAQESPTRSPVNMDDLDRNIDLPAIAEILEEHRHANLPFTNKFHSTAALSPIPSALISSPVIMADSMDSSASASASDGRGSRRSHKQSDVSSSSSGPRPNHTRYHISHQPTTSSNVVLSSTLSSNKSTSTLIPAAPISTATKPMMSSSTGSSIPFIPGPPIPTNYWPQYDTKQDFGYKYVRGGGEDEPVTQPPITMVQSAPPIPTNPFQFEFQVGFQLGQPTSTPIPSKKKATVSTLSTTPTTSFTATPGTAVPTFTMPNFTELSSSPPLTQDSSSPNL